MEDFPANSQKAKARSDRPEKVERVTSAEAVRRKKGIGQQFKDTFIGGSAKMAAEYMLTDVVIPAIRDTLAEAIQGGIERLIYGDTRPRSRRGAPPSYSNVGHVDYQGMGSQSRKPPGSNRMLSRQSRARHNFDELVIQSRTEAEEVLDRMFDELSRYGVVPVSVLYELTGVQSSHTDHKWGWTELRGARVSRLRSGGYLLDLPEPVSLS